MDKPVIFFGTDAFSVPPLVRLLADKRNIAGVVTKLDRPAGRGQLVTQPAVKRLAESQGIPVLQPARLLDIEQELAGLRPFAGIVVAYGKIIPLEILSLFQGGLINVHASLLPKYRGSCPIESAILAGDEDTGVTLMRLDEGMDTGPTYESKSVQLTGKETRIDLYEQLSELGAELLAAKLTDILDGRIVPIPQDNSQASTTRKIEKSDGVIDWDKPAEQLEREVRAYLGWPGSRTTLSGVEVTVNDARVLPGGKGAPGAAFKTPSGELAVRTGDGSLIIDRLKPAGKREMAGPEFLAGHPLPNA